MAAVRYGQKVEGRFQYHAEQALVADEQSSPVRTNRVAAGATPLNHLAGCQYGPQPQDMIGGHTIFKAVGATGVEPDITSDGADRLARWIRGKKETMPCGGAGYVGVHDPGLDDGDALLGIDPTDSIQ